MPRVLQNQNLKRASDLPSSSPWRWVLSANDESRTLDPLVDSSRKFFSTHRPGKGHPRLEPTNSGAERPISTIGKNPVKHSIFRSAD